jgi:hypothetical protein
VRDQDNPPPPDQQDRWEQAVEAELAALRREIERLAHEVLKLGSRVNVLMKEHEQRLRAEGARR